MGAFGGGIAKWSGRPEPMPVQVQINRVLQT
jgi:hypothetical protein